MAQGDAGNLKIQQEINKVLQTRAALLASNQKALSGQVQTAIQLCKALKCEDLDKIAQQMGDIDNATLKAAKAAEEFGNKSKKASDAAVAGTKRENEELVKKEKLLNVGKAAAIGAFGGLMSGIAGSLNMLKGLGKGLLGIVGSVMKLGKTILMLPFKVMGGLIGMAQSGGGGGPSPIRLELEAIRKEYGSLASNEGKALASVQKSVQKSSQNLAGTGLRLAKVFGRGRKGVAEAMKQAGEIAKALGPAFNQLTGEFEKNAVQLTMLTRGFTGSADATAAMLRHAKALGKDGTKYITEITGMAQTMGKQFGISAKIIGKGMGEMMKDISNFGHMAKKEMLAATVYAGKLGLEIKDLAGVMNKFLNFEDAAEGAAQMAQAFGMNIDAMELMKGGPEAIDEMRRAFHESGKSLEDMTAAERKLLEQQTGLTGAAMESAFSAENQGTSYKDMAKGADTAEDQAKSQTEVMNKLADSIDRVFGSGGGKKFKSFFDAFVQGFQSGIMKTKEMRKLMKNLRKSLKEVFRGGRDVGKMFVKSFPGVKQMIKGMSDLFDPRRIKKLMKEITKVFGSFFKDLETNPDTAVDKFFERMTKAFKKWFSGSGPAAGAMKKGGGKFLKALGAIFKGLLVKALKGLTSLFNGIADAIRNPPEIKSALGQAFADFGKSIWAIIKQLGPPLADAFGNMMSAAFEKLKGSKHVQNIKNTLMKILLAKILIAAALGAVKGAAVAMLTNVIGPFFKKLAFASSKVKPPIPITPPATGPAITEAATINGPGGAIDWKGAMKKGALIVIFIAVTIVALAGAFRLAAEIIKELSAADVMKTGTMMLMMAGVLIVIAGAAKMTSSLDPVSMMKSLGIMLLVMPLLGGVGFILAMIIKKTTLPSIGELFAWGIMMGVAIGAAGMAIWAAGIAGKLIDTFGAMTLLKGLGILALVMVALGAVGVIIGFMISLVPDPKNVSTMMMAIASIMLVTLLMLPAAFALGAMLLIPFGGFGILALLAGFGIMGLLASTMVLSLMPAIAMIAAIKLENPASFKAITEAIVAIIKGVAAFADAVGRILEALDPGIAAKLTGSASDQLQKSMKSVESLIAAIMTPMQSIIDKMIELAKQSGIEKESVDAIMAIGSVLTAMGSLMKSLSPSDAAFAAVQEADSIWDPGAAARLMNSIAAGQKQAIEAAVPMIKSVGALIVTIGDAVDGADFSAVGPLLTGMGPILAGIAGLMKAMSPSEGEMAAVQEAANTWGGDEVGLMEAMNDRMIKGMEAMKPLIKTIAEELGALITDHLSPMIEKIGEMDIDPGVIAGIGTIISGLMSGMGKMMEVIGPAMETMQSNVEDNWFWGPSDAEQMSSQMGDFGTMMGALGGAFTNMLPAITTFVQGMVTLGQTLTDPEAAGEQLEVIGKAVAMLGDVIGPLTKSMDMIGSYKKKLGNNFTNTVYWFFGSPGGGGNDGLLAVLVDSVGRSIGDFMDSMRPIMSKIKDPKKAALQLEVISKSIKALGDITGPLIKTIDMLGKYKGSGTKWNEEVSWYFKKGGFLDTLVESVGRAIAAFVTKLLDIKIPNPDQASKQISVITQSIAAAGTLLKMVGDAMKMIVKHKDSDWSTEVKFYFGKNGLVAKMADSLGSGLGTITTKIMDTVKGIGNPDHAAKQVALVAQVLESVQTFVGVIDTASKLKVRGGRGAAKGLDAVMTVMAGISAQIAYSMPQVIDGVLGAIEGSNPAKVSKLWKYRHSIKILGTLMCAVGQFASAITSISSLGDSPRKTNKVLRNMSELFGDRGWAREALINIVDAVGNLDFTKITSATSKGMNTVSSFICEVGKFVSSVTGMTWDAKFYKKVKVLSMGLDGKGGDYGPIKAAQNLIDAIVGKGGGGFQANSSNIHVKTIQKLATFLTDGMVPAMNAITSIPSTVTSRVTDVKTAVTDLQEISAAISKKEIKAAVQIGEALSGSGYVSLDLTKDLTMNVHVKVNMSSEQIAKGIIKTDAMGKALGQGAA